MKNELLKTKDLKALLKNLIIIEDGLLLLQYSLRKTTILVKEILNDKK